MTDKDYMKPLASIAIDAAEAIAGVLHQYVATGQADPKGLSELRKAVEFRIDALSVVGSPVDDEKRLLRVLKRIITEDLL